MLNENSPSSRRRHCHVSGLQRNGVHGCGEENSYYALTIKLLLLISQVKEIVELGYVLPDARVCTDLVHWTVLLIAYQVCLLLTMNMTLRKPLSLLIWFNLLPAQSPRKISSLHATTAQCLLNCIHINRHVDQNTWRMLIRTYRDTFVSDMSSLSWMDVLSDEHTVSWYLSHYRRNS